jgi:PAS domain S-box-containing protein
MEAAGDGKTGQVITQVVDADKSQIFFLTSIINSSEDAVICTTPEGLITSWNPAAERIFGYRAGEVLGKPLSVLESPDKQGEMSELQEKVRNGASVNRYQTHRSRKDGSVIHIALTISLIHSPEGELVGIASIARDLTERNRIVADYQRIFETTGDGILILDAQTGEILDVNPFLVWLLDYSRDDLLGKKLWDIGLWSDVAASKASFAELQQKEYLRYEDYPLVARGGRKIFVEFISNVYQAGAAQLIQCNIRDMTSHKASAESMAVSESRYRRLFETAQDGILILDAESGKITDVNPFLEDMLGYSREEFVGKRLWEIGPFKDKEASKRAYRELSSKSYIRYDDLPLEASDGRQCAVEFVSNVYLVGQAKVIQCNIRDITARRKLEAQIKGLNADLTARVSELEEANQELDAFNRMASHDLRQPLNTIGTSCQALELLCGDKLDDECRKYVHIAYERVLAMSGLIEALLKFSRMAHTEPRLETLNLSEMSSNVFLELKLGDPERRVTFKAPECLTAVGDPNLMYSVLQNLIGNAWKYTGKKDDALIELGATENAGVRVYFVRDNGIGFAPADAGKLFNPFERLPGSEGFQGNGIGLATVDRIIRRHHGRIRAEGVAGKGATFYFTLPGKGVAREAAV